MQKSQQNKTKIDGTSSRKLVLPFDLVLGTASCSVLLLLYVNILKVLIIPQLSVKFNLIFTFR